MKMDKKLTIFNFFDNEEFVKVNKDKIFTNEEKVALIIRSVTTSLNDKFEVLNEITNECSDELRENIFDWIDMKNKQLEYIKNLKIDNDISCLTLIEEHSYIVPFSSFEDALSNDMSHYNGFISFYSAKSKKIIIRVYTNEHTHRFSDDGKIDYLEDITNIDFFTSTKEENSLNDTKLDIYKYIVELESPFKPFDFVYAPSFTDFYDYFVVADKNDPDVQKEISKCSKLSGIYAKNGYWLKINTPNYFLETNKYGGHNVEVGEVTQSYIHEYERCRLDRIKVYRPTEITVGTKNYINKIKKQLKEKYFDNLDVL